VSDVLPDEASSVTSTSKPTLGARRETFIVTLAAIFGVIATFAVYRPDRNLPFDFLDFSEFLPLLQKGSSFVDRLFELLSYYGGRGRFNVVAHAGIAAKWEVLGDSATAWQWTRFATMWVAILLVYLLLRRIGISRLAAIAGCAVLPFAPVTVDAWMRLTTTEPLGVVLLLSGCLLALQPYHEKRREQIIGVLFALICITTVFVKEMLVVTLLLPLLLVYADSSLTSRVPSRRHKTLLGGMIVGVPIAVIPVLVTAARASRDAYTATFGSHLRPLSDALGTWLLSLLPFDPSSSFPPRLTGLALLSLLAILGWGWRLRMLMPNVGHGIRPRRLLVAALIFSATGTLSYLPWPELNRFYWFPYFLSLVILVAVAFGAIEVWSRRAFAFVCLVLAVLLSSAAADSASHTNRMEARRLTNRAVVSRLAQLHQSFDTVLAATNQRQPAAWQELGPTLERYGRVFGLDMPVIINTTCAESRRRSSMNAAIVAYRHHCVGFSAPHPVVLPYRRLRFPPLSITTDSLRIDFIVPSQSRVGKR
jgi:hypothetical protein